eukprot:jgi/Ulvmu1/6040/UM027_0016.1
MIHVARARLATGCGIPSWLGGKVAEEVRSDAIPGSHRLGAKKPPSGDATRDVWTTGANGARVERRRERSKVQSSTAGIEPAAF